MNDHVDHWELVRLGIRLQQVLRAWPGPIVGAIENFRQLLDEQPIAARAILLTIKRYRMSATELTRHTREAERHNQLGRILTDAEILAEMPTLPTNAIGQVQSALTYGRT